MAEPVIEEYRLRNPATREKWTSWMNRRSSPSGLEIYGALHDHEYQFRLVHGGNVIAGPVDVDPAKVRPGDPVDYGGDYADEVREKPSTWEEVRAEMQFTPEEEREIERIRVAQTGECKGAPRHHYQVGGSHYQTGDHEPFLVIDEWSSAWPKPAVFYLACAVKYIARLGRKGDEESWKQDLDKAVHYLQEAKKRIR